MAFMSARNCILPAAREAEVKCSAKSNESPERDHPRPDLSRTAAGGRAADEVRGEADRRDPPRAGRGRDLRAGVADRLAGRLSRAAPQTGHYVRSADGSARRQAP